MRVTICIAAIFLSAVSSNLHSQPAAAFGELRGRVTDPTEAILAGAAVRLINSETNLTYETVSSGEGEYAFLLVPPGRYDLQVRRDGFKTGIVKGIEVTVGQVAVLDVRL